MTNFDENKALVDVILSNGLIDIRFASFPGTAMSSKKNAESLPPPPPKKNVLDKDQENNFFFTSALFLVGFLLITSEISRVLKLQFFLKIFFYVRRFVRKTAAPVFFNLSCGRIKLNEIDFNVKQTV